MSAEQRSQTWELAEQRRRDLRARAEAVGYPDLEPGLFYMAARTRRHIVAGHYLGPGLVLWGYALTDATPEELAAIDTALTHYEAIQRLGVAA